MNRKEKLLKIIDTYGIIPQLKYFQSEVFELTEAIITKEYDYQSMETTRKIDEENKNHIAEEIADVLVMLEQFRLFYNIDKEDIEKIMDYKIDRQIKRIEKIENEIKK